MTAPMLTQPCAATDEPVDLELIFANPASSTVRGTGLGAGFDAAPDFSESLAS